MPTTRPSTTHQPTRKLLFQCPLCKELVYLQRFSADHGRLCIECPACLQQALYTADADISPSVALPRSPLPSLLSQEAKEPTLVVEHTLSTPLIPEDDRATDFNTPAPAFQSKASAVQEPDDEAFCPKCWEKRRIENSSCHKCGLVFANIGVTFDPNKDAIPSGTVGREARALWAALLAGWEEEPLHKQFLQYCQAQGFLEFAAQCYRKERAKRGASEMIDTQLERLLDLAQQQFLQASKADTEPANSTTRIVVLLLMLLGGGTLLVMLLRFWQIGGGWNP
ncbi:hypothetical protein L6R29_05360 [Myxococcota bacterium]|nr:hypothetical protein [Myxococcota bacterium]